MEDGGGEDALWTGLFLTSFLLGFFFFPESNMVLAFLNEQDHGRL